MSSILSQKSMQPAAVIPSRVTLTLGYVDENDNEIIVLKGSSNKTIFADFAEMLFLWNESNYEAGLAFLVGERSSDPHPGKGKRKL